MRPMHRVWKAQITYCVHFCPLDEAASRDNCLLTPGMQGVGILPTPPSMCMSEHACLFAHANKTQCMSPHPAHKQKTFLAVLAGPACKYPGPSTWPAHCAPRSALLELAALRHGWMLRAGWGTLAEPSSPGSLLVMEMV